jgi:hypothetical protein
MKCKTVSTKLAGYLDDALIGAARAEERVAMREHLEACAHCRMELQRYRRLSVLMSRVPNSEVPADLAVRIKVAAAQAQASRDWRGRWQEMRDHAAVVLENVFRPITLPATGGFFSAIIVFALVLQILVPGISVQAVPNDTETNLLRPAELISLSEYPDTWATEPQDMEASLPHGLLLDVTVDARGRMADYQVLSGPTSSGVRRQLDQLLFFSRFKPMMSFGRPTSGGHVVLSFDAVHVRG